MSIITEDMLSELREKVFRRGAIVELKEAALAMQLEVPEGDDEKTRKKLVRMIVEAFDECDDGLEVLIRETAWPAAFKKEIDRICNISVNDDAVVKGPEKEIVDMPALSDMRASLAKLKAEQDFEDKCRREMEIRERVQEEFLRERSNKSLLNDAVTLGIKREFRVQGTIGGNEEKRLDYISLQSQVAEAKQRQYSDDEITFALRRAVAVGSELRQYLDALGAEVSLGEVMDFIRSAYKEKTASELFKELSQLRQNKDEENQDFLFRALALKAKTMRAAELDAEYEYSAELIGATFKRAFYTGLKDAATRVLLKSLLRVDSKTSDKELIEEVNKVSAEETEFSTKHATSAKTQVRVNEVSVEKKIGEAMKPVCDTMAQMTAQLVAMQEEIKELKAQKNQSSQSKPRRKYGCSDCQAKNQHCTHCFNCGKDDHKSNGCPTKKASTNC